MGKEVEKPTEKQAEELDDEKEVQKEKDKRQENLSEESIESMVEDEELVEDIVVENETEKSIESTIQDEEEETTEQEIVDSPKKKSPKHKKIVISILAILGTLLLFYFGMTIYFMNHFYFGSEVNGRDVSGKSVEYVKKQMESEFKDYVLQLKELGGESEEIKATDVGLSYNLEEVNRFKDRQNPFAWILSCLDTGQWTLTLEFTYDERLLKKQIDGLTCFDKEHIIEPTNPSFQYVNNSYDIVEEVLGNKVDKEILYSHVAEALLRKDTEIDLEKINAYIKPQYNVTSQKIIAAKDILNKYVSSKITYSLGSSEETIDGSVIHKWITVDEAFHVTVNEEEVKNYIKMLSKKYNTPGWIRNFKTSSGEMIQISGGDFSQPIHIKKETENIITDIKAGRIVTRKPVYGKTVISYINDDIGNTYVEIDLTQQHIWFYKNSTLIVEGDVVTGNVSNGHTTPKGIYSLKYKAKNVVLRGPGYAAPVTYWMPFNGGIGMHDANWRSVFGGEIYKTKGSHGCINCPEDVAKEIYDHIEQGTPVVCY